MAGIIGIIAAIIGILWVSNTYRGFVILWFSAAVLVIVGTLLIARRQALKDKEVFWSPPARRVVQAIIPPLAAGLCLGVLPVFLSVPFGIAAVVAPLWILFYGLALHAAGFFIQRGIKFFGILFVVGACLLFCVYVAEWIKINFNAHWLMGFFFGGLHLAYGAYLYLTEKGKNAA
ncbi:MAG: hypothetical protein WDM76_04215 [Limisphaerales bacterium]